MSACVSDACACPFTTKFLLLEAKLFAKLRHFFCAYKFQSFAKPIFSFLALILAKNRNSKNVNSIT